MNCNKILSEILEGLEAQRDKTFEEHNHGWNTAVATLSEVIDYIREIKYNHEIEENQCEEQKS